jgi:hypothetical protein
MKTKLFLSALFVCALAFTGNAQTKQPRTVREFFNLLPQRYFPLEGCEDNPTKANCEKARMEYVKNFKEIEDTANGYWKSGCDGAQSCLTMALFKRPDATYLVALQLEFDSSGDNYFLEYKNGGWSDISRQVVPNFSENNIYELPRTGTTVHVFAVDKSGEIPAKGKKLYDLVWKNGKFSVKR